MTIKDGARFAIGALFIYDIYKSFLLLAKKFERKVNEKVKEWEKEEG